MGIYFSSPVYFLSNTVAVPLFVMADGCAIFTVRGKNRRVAIPVNVCRTLLVCCHADFKQRFVPGGQGRLFRFLRLFRFCQDPNVAFGTALAFANVRITRGLLTGRVRTRGGIICLGRGCQFVLCGLPGYG